MTDQTTTNQTTADLYTAKLVDIAERLNLHFQGRDSWRFTYLQSGGGVEVLVAKHPKLTGHLDVEGSDEIFIGDGPGYLIWGDGYAMEAGEIGQTTDGRFTLPAVNRSGCDWGHPSDHIVAAIAYTFESWKF